MKRSFFPSFQPGHLEAKCLIPKPETGLSQYSIELRPISMTMCNSTGSIILNSIKSSRIIPYQTRFPSRTRSIIDSKKKSVLENLRISSSPRWEGPYLRFHPKRLVSQWANDFQFFTRNKKTTKPRIFGRDRYKKRLQRCQEAKGGTVFVRSLMWRLL